MRNYFLALVGCLVLLLSGTNANAGHVPGRVGIGAFEQRQFATVLVAEVMALIEMPVARKSSYSPQLIDLAVRDADVYKYLQTLKTYFNSNEFKALTDEKKAAERSQARIILEMTIKQDSLVSFGH